MAKMYLTKALRLSSVNLLDERSRWLGWSSSVSIWFRNWSIASSCPTPCPKRLFESRILVIWLQLANIIPRVSKA